MAEVRAREIRVDGIRTRVWEAGPDAESPDAESPDAESADGAEAVVFVHGNPGSGADWLPLLARVGGFARAVAWDAPGFGQAAKPPAFPQTVEGHAGFLGAVLDQLGIARAHLVLHDFGGMWGLAWAADHPDRFGSLVLVDTGVLRGYRGHLLAWIWQVPVLGELFMAATNRFTFRRQLRVGNPRGLPAGFVDRMYRDYDRDTRRAVLRLYRATARRVGMPSRLADRLGQLDRPALVVWGAHDPYLPVRLASRQQEVFRSAEVRVFESSGHWPFVDDPERVEPVIEEFLRRVSAG